MLNGRLGIFCIVIAIVIKIKETIRFRKQSPYVLS